MVRYVLLRLSDGYNTLEERHVPSRTAADTARILNQQRHQRKERLGLDDDGWRWIVAPTQPKED